MRCMAVRLVLVLEVTGKSEDEDENEPFPSRASPNCNMPPIAHELGAVLA